jgi:hypothetical protein
MRRLLIVILLLMPCAAGAQYFHEGEPPEHAITGQQIGAPVGTGQQPTVVVQEGGGLINLGPEFGPLTNALANLFVLLLALVEVAGRAVERYRSIRDDIQKRRAASPPPPS